MLTPYVLISIHEHREHLQKKLLWIVSMKQTKRWCGWVSKQTFDCEVLHGQRNII